MSTPHRASVTRPSGKAPLETTEVTVATGGVLQVHACSPALCPHVEWAVARELGVPVDLKWTASARPGQLRAEGVWRGRPGTADRLAAALRRWTTVTFEVTEDASVGADGQRYSYTPDLGLFRAVVSANGDVLVQEDRLRLLLARSTRADDLAQGVDELLGAAWDEELEPLRASGFGAEVAFLQQVV